MLNFIFQKMGYVKKSKIKEQLNYGRSVGKRLDEHRELVENLEKAGFFEEYFWCVGHTAIQDDYLMRLYFIVHECWPDENLGEKRIKQITGEYVRKRPEILGKCHLPEYPQQ